MQRARLPIANSGRTFTNPVWAFQTHLNADPSRLINPTLADERLRAWILEAEAAGVQFPKFLMSKYPKYFGEHAANIATKPQPRVVGLLLRSDVTNQHDKFGLVTPLHTHLSNSTFVSQNLPFDEFEIRDAIYRLVNASGPLQAAIVPELVSFAISEKLGEQAGGASMDIAGLLSVLDVLSNNTSPVLARACAVVYPNGDQLEPVESVGEKLFGFLREYGKGTLLVCHEDCQLSEKYACDFEEVWLVRSFADLANYLQEAQLLEPLLSMRRITAQHMESATRFIADLGARDGTKVALRFAERVERSLYAASPSGNQPLRLQQQLQWNLEELHRHLGNYAAAVTHSQKAVDVLESMEQLSSFQEILDARVRLAAAMFDAHDFYRAKELLESSFQEVRLNPRIVRAESRAHLNNTLGRIGVVIGGADWHSLFQDSLDIQEVIAPEDVSRTRCYLLHGLLRSDQLVEARTQLELAIKNGEFGNPYMKFYAADYLRRSGFDNGPIQKLADPDSTRKGHAYGLYLQSRARSRWGSAESADLFDEAFKVFKEEADRQNPDSILELFACLMQLAFFSARADIVGFDKTLKEIFRILERREAIHISNWYLPFIPSKIDQASVEKLLARVPYF